MVVIDGGYTHGAAVDRIDLKKGSGKLKVDIWTRNDG